jgi:hypothetical protein
MKTLVATLLACAMLVACATGEGPTRPPGYYPKMGDGTTPETAVMIRSLSDSEINRTVARWIKKNYPNFKVLDQMVWEEHGRTFTKVMIAGPNEGGKQIYFDISMYARRSGNPDTNPTGLPPRP